MQVSIRPSNPDENHTGINLNLEFGIYQALADLIKIDNNIMWDPVGAFFCLSGGYRVQRNGGGGAVYDPYDQEIYLTNEHIKSLFAIATLKRANGARGFLGSLSKLRNK